jgi:copper(I)-binding protein
MRTRQSILTTRLLLLPAAALVVAPLAGCGGDDNSDSTAGTAAESTADAAAGSEDDAGDDVIAVEDAWVKASAETMTAAFGVITNTGDDDLTVLSAQTSASDVTELHEVVMQDGQMIMRPKEGGFVVPAGGEHVLEPGADHVMIMNLQDPVEPGDDVEITLDFDDGSTYTYTAQAREADVGNEEYVPGEGSMDHGGDMGGEMEDGNS